MKKYNRSLDYMLLAMVTLQKGKPVTAARMLDTAAKQPDFKAAMQILEASNKHAYMTEQAAVTAKKRLTASDEFPFEDGQGDGELAADLGEDFEGDPLDEVSDEDLEIESAADEGDDEGDDEDTDEMEAEDEEEEAEEAPAPAPVAAARKETSAKAMARVLSSMQRKTK